MLQTAKTSRSKFTADLWGFKGYKLAKTDVLEVCLTHRLHPTSQFALESVERGLLSVPHFHSRVAQVKKELRYVFVLEYGTWSFSG